MKNKGSSGLPYKRVVVKFGTSLLTSGSNSLDLNVMADLVRQVARLHELGIELVIVSSGAINSGKNKLGLAKTVKGMPFKQVCFSVGQSRLMNVYEQLFDTYGITIAQGLLTKTELSDRSGYLNIRNTLLGLLELGVICIVNENDMVAIDEIHEAKFGDNDNLSAMVANLIDADLLIILTEVDGLFTTDPHINPDAKLIPSVAYIDESIERLASGTLGKLGTGGMITKIEAAKHATASGVTVIIANGRTPDVIIDTASGKPLGTIFKPVTGHLDSRDRWLLSGLCTKGKLVVDTGAVAALQKQHRSLLAAGINSVKGNFHRGDIVDIMDTAGNYLGAGITNYNAGDIDIIKGLHSQKIAEMIGCDYGPEVIHRNNLVVI